MGEQAVPGDSRGKRIRFFCNSVRNNILTGIC